ncbi:class I adenylate-forming enzyme family protein [Streptomyces canus]|uniref:class I adenylate-forming enzyme family protein n=1 Tax=Streptomyces canus TaxID=58343 RepID=UPI00372065BA
MTTTMHADLTPHHRDILDSTIPEALDRAAAKWPDRLALTFVGGSENVTWAQLREEVGRLRAGLETAGVRPGDKVGVILRNQVEWPLTWLAVIEAGAVIVPVNPKCTVREVEFVLTDAEASWCVIAGDLAGSVVTGGKIGPISQDRVIVVGEEPGEQEGEQSLDGALDFAVLRTHEVTARRHRAKPLDLVNIQFTSGTTGLPKGCMLTHTYWLHLGVYSAAEFGDPQRILADHPFYYMQNQAYLMMALAGGGALYVTPGLSRRKFMGWLTDHQIDFAWIDEGMLDLADGYTADDLALKRAPVAGLPKSLHRPLEERFGLRAREWYASTEVAGGTYVPSGRDDLVGTGSMGICWPGRESKIVDADLNEVPSGVSGELCLRGPGMMLGYHNRPEANAELFLPGGWFRTGDVVRKDADGHHYYEGRTRDIVRRSGESIACAEIELLIMAMREVEEAGVVPVPDPVRDEEVKAVVVTKPGASLTAEEVVAWCREGLAAFKVPRYVEFRDALPHTPSGKIHKVALRAEEPFGPGVVDMQARPAPAR